ncbi:hypothetical protein D7X94_09420 [Acutalibacter sp. 1XD8-33]|nr:hypothetical protein D7X94_09420 [Acutalibacter sp. 1XD8-33]
MAVGETGFARFPRRFSRRTNPSGAPDAENGEMRKLGFVRRHEFCFTKLYQARSKRTQLTRVKVFEAS